EFFFDTGQHDAGQKTFLGQAGPLDGSDVVAALASHPATAERIGRKLFEFLAYPEPEPDVLEPLVAAFTDSGQDVARLVEAILRSHAFYSDRSRFEHVKSPVEFVVDTVRLLGASVRERELVSVLRSLGQEILNPPNVAGWPGGATWINPTTLLTRFNFAAR